MITIEKCAKKVLNDHLYLPAYNLYDNYTKELFVSIFHTEYTHGIMLIKYNVLDQHHLDYFIAHQPYDVKGILYDLESKPDKKIIFKQIRLNVNSDGSYIISDRIRTYSKQEAQKEYLRIMLGA